MDDLIREGGEGIPIDPEDEISKEELLKRIERLENIVLECRVENDIQILQEGGPLTEEDLIEEELLYWHNNKSEGSRMKVTVIYPVTFEVPDKLISDEIYDTQERIKDYADKIFEATPSNPVIHDCDNEDYIE